jgi:signal transduction histidine kinase/DNA-binding response OmpR family regulator
VLSAASETRRPLRGRARERNLLAAALADDAVRAIIARGDAGVGKSALLDQARHELAETGALTGVGQHADGDHSADFAPLVAALEQAIAVGLEQLYEPDAGLATLAAALGPKAAVFADVGSGLLHGMAVRASSSAMPAEAAEERFVQAVITVLHWLEGFNQPIVLMIDDWGRSSDRAGRLYERILSEPGLSRLRLLATERPREPSKLARHAAAWTVQLSPLDGQAIGEIMLDLLGDGGGHAAKAVLAFLHIDGGVPFDLLQAVLLLEQVGALSRDGTQWRFDADVAARVLGESPAFTIVERLSRLAPDELALAGALAVYGRAMDCGDLLAAWGLDPGTGGATIARLALIGVFRSSGEAVAVAHDRITESLLATLSEAERQSTAARLAEGMRRMPEPTGAGLSAMLSLRLDAGLDEADPVDWAGLYALGAGQARAIGDRVNAVVFAEAGLLLAERAGLVTQDILTEAALAAVLEGDHQRGRDRADRLTQIARDARELAQADEVRMFAARMAGDMDRALEVGIEAAGRAGISVPARPTLLDVGLEVLRIRLTDTRRAMAAGPLSDETLTLIAPRLRVLMAAGSLLHERNMHQALIHGGRSARGTLGSGTALGASVCAFVCAMTGGYESAGRWAEISDARQSPAQPNRAAAMLTTTYFGHWFVRPRAELVGRNDEAEAMAYAEGDLSTAAYANRNRSLDSLFLGRSLAATAALADQGLVVAARLNDLSTGPVIAAVRQIAENLMTPGPDRWRLRGEHFDAAAYEPSQTDSAALMNNVYRPLAMLEAFLAALCGAFAETAAIHDRLNWTFKLNPHNPQMAIWIFNTGLGLYRAGRSPPRRQLNTLRRLARLNPRDHRHRILLLDAERARLGGRTAAALAAYEGALEAALAADCLLEQGLVARAAAEGAAMLGAPAAATGFQLKAEAAWRAAGAANLAASPLDAPESADAADLQAQLTQLSADYEKRELELATARDAAERANRAKSRLLASVGHELRTPLQGISGLVELAAIEGKPADLKVLAGAVDQLSTVVGDLTDLGALDGGGLSLIASPFDPRALVSSVVSVHEPSLAGTGRRIVQAMASDAPPVMGDDGRLRQILSNLIGNAVKHGAGDITVRLNAVDAGDDRIGLTIEVDDEGPGLSPTDVVRLFEPFERGPAADRIAGLGLGLSIARRLAQAMDGDLTAHSAAGEGASFRLTLELPRAADRPGTSGPPGHAARVLLAEDTPLSRRVLAALLRAEGALVEEAEDGDEALALTTRLDFDLMILDMRMPRRDGLEVARAVRGGGRNHDKPIAIVTASSSPDIGRRAVELGVQAMLQKPIGRTGLRRLLASAESGQWTPAAETVDDAGATADRLAELRLVLGDGEAADLLVQVRPNILAAAERIQAAFQAGETATATREAHRLAGLASHFGLTAVSRAAYGLETRLDGASITVLRDAIHNTDWAAFPGFAPTA